MPFCPVCYEDNNDSAHCSLTCSHTTCKPCLASWFEACEKTGQSAPTCPVCRVEVVNEEEVTIIMGRPFQAAGLSTSATSGEMTDEFTRHYLSESAKCCRNCGFWIVKDEEGCNLMQCLCGYRFCWQCGTPGGRRCKCSPRNHIFWDNILRQRSISSRTHRIATQDELEDFRSYMCRKKQERKQSQESTETDEKSFPASASQHQHQEQPEAFVFQQQPGWEDANSYVASVYERFENNPRVFYNFLEILKKYKKGIMRVGGVSKEVKALFQGHPDLQNRFLIFLPDSEQHDTINTDQRSQISACLRQVERHQLHGQQGSSSIVLHEGKAKMKRLECSHEETVFANVSNTLSEPIKPIEMQQTKHSAKKTSRILLQQEDHHQGELDIEKAISYVKKVKRRFEKQNQNNTYENFLDILNEYKGGTKEIRRVSDDVANLFHGHSDLQEQFTAFLPESHRKKAKKRLLLHREGQSMAKKQRLLGQQSRYA